MYQITISPYESGTVSSIIECEFLPMKVYGAKAEITAHKVEGDELVHEMYWRYVPAYSDDGEIDLSSNGTWERHEIDM